MSIWKSPVFYFGVLLVAVVFAALIAPFVINWNAYRNNLEGWGHKLTGREVAINGPISVRLFPWPKLVAEDVSLANPKGFSEEAMLNAKRIEVQLNLAGLFSGEFNVDAIDIQHPVITIARNRGGLGNWNFLPDIALKQSKLLEKIKLEQVHLIDGALRLRDVSRNIDTSFVHLNADLSATAIEGPWRIRGGAQNGDVPMDFTFSSAMWKADEVFKFSMRVAPRDGALPALVFDGTQDQGAWKGKLRLEPVVTDDGRQSLDQSFKPLVMQADVVASFNDVKLDAVHIVPADAKDSGTLIEGSAHVAFDQGVKADVNLSSPRIDLDSLAGGSSLRIWRAGGVMALLNRVISEFPEKLDLTAALDVTSLSAAGETLENVKLKTSAQQGAVRIQNFSANLPGRSAMKFDGIAFPGTEAAELGGTLALESNDTRAFASWLWPEGKNTLAQYWTGARGRLKAQSDVTWSGKRFGFQNLRYELDGEPGNAELAVALGKLPSLDLHVNAKVLDIDNYFSGGLAKLIGAADYSSFGQNGSGIDRRLALQAGKLRMNGVEAQDVALDFSSSFSGFEIKKLDVGSIEGAHVNGSGLVLQGPDGPSGDLKFSVNAENPRGLLRLMGAFSKGPDPSWAIELGQTNIQADVTVRPGKNEPLVKFTTSGAAGPFQISASGDAKNVAGGRDAILGLSAEISSAESNDIAKLFGLSSQVSGLGAGRLVMTATGSGNAGFKTTAQVDMFGAQLAFDGQYQLGKILPLVGGTASLHADEVKGLAAAMGASGLDMFSGPLSLKAELASADHKIGMKSLVGSIGINKLSGEASIGEDGTINANLAFDYLDLQTVFSGLFMPWHNKVAAIDDRFADATPEGWRGEIWLRPTELQSFYGTTVHEAVIGMAIEQRSRILSLVSPDQNDDPLKLDLAVRQAGDNYDVESTGQIALPLAPIMADANDERLADGKIIFDGEMKGQGRSPMAALSGATGKGNYRLAGASFTMISPDPFYKQIDNVKDASAVQNAFAELMLGPGFNLLDQTMPFTVEKGALHSPDIAASTQFATALIAPQFDFGTGELKTEIQLSGKARSDLPAIRMTYSGALGQLVRRSDTSEISAKLGYALIARDMAELDRVKKEQERLAAEEAQQTLADQTKFAAYQAQRLELRLRLREMKVHAAQRVLDAEKRKANLQKLIVDSIVINKNEVQRFLRMVRGH